VFFEPLFETVQLSRQGSPPSSLQEAGNFLRSALHPNAAPPEKQPLFFPAQSEMRPSSKAHSSPRIPFFAANNIGFLRASIILPLFKASRRLRKGKEKQDCPASKYRSLHEFLIEVAVHDMNFDIPDLSTIQPLFHKARKAAHTFLSELANLLATDSVSAETIGGPASMLYYRLGVLSPLRSLPDLFCFEPSLNLDDLFPPYRRSMPEECYGKRAELFAEFWNAWQRPLGLPVLKDAIWTNEFPVPIFYEQDNAADPLLMAAIILSFLSCFSPQD